MKLRPLWVVVLLLPTWAAVAVATEAVGLGCIAAAEGQIRVALVIDYGELRPGAEPETACVSVPTGATGYQVLTAWSSTANVTMPRVNDVGFLCGIGGLPETGCAEASGASYTYWSYWTAKGTDSDWTYSSIGMDSRRVKNGGVEGWHFVTGKGSGADLAPRARPNSVACSLSDGTTSGTTAPVAAPAAPPAEQPKQQSPPLPASIPPTSAAQPTTGNSRPNSQGSASSPSVLASPAPGSPIGATPQSGSGDAVISANDQAAVLGETTIAAPRTPTEASDPQSATPTNSVAGYNRKPPGAEQSNTPAAETDSTNSRSLGGLIPAAVFVVASVALATIQARRKRLKQ